VKFLRYAKDGGPESNVAGLFIVEIKQLFSIVLLHFGPGSRDAYHSHAFNSVSWVLKGRLDEHHYDASIWPKAPAIHTPSVRPVITRRSTFHRVFSVGHTWVFSFRGPWSKTWREWLPAEQRFVTLAHGRKVVAA
jgi:hypothetical protein